MFIFNAEKKMRENWRVFSYVVTEPESPLRDSIPTRSCTRKDMLCRRSLGLHCSEFERVLARYLDVRRLSAKIFRHS